MIRSAVIVVAVCAACASQAPASDAPPRAPQAEAARPAPAEPVAAPRAPEIPRGATAFESNAGTYVIRVAPATDKLPNNAQFDLELWISERAHPDAPASDVALAVDAAMPEHGHGMVRAPVVERAGDGHFVVHGMLLHMTGRWELYFDITRGAVTERAQVEVKLE